MYKDVSEKANYAKFAKLRERGMHTNPSLLAGDMKSGSEYMMYADMEPLAVKKFQNFKEYVSIYPEFSHVFIGDNGQGDVRGGGENQLIRHFAVIDELCNDNLNTLN